MALIYLCGITGVGKSTTGRALAKALEYDCVDTDDEIVKAAGKSIADIFDEEDEAGFRMRESAVITKTLRNKNCVVALGGGAVTVPANLANILQHGTLIHLRASAREIAARVFGDTTRPFLAGAATVEELEQLLERLLRRRADLYGQAHLTFDIDMTKSAVENASMLKAMLLGAGIV